MLFIENEPLKLSPELVSELRAELKDGKFLKLPKGSESKTVDSDGNPITEYPAGRSIPYVANVDLDMDTFKLASKSTKNARYVQVRYCETIAGTKDKPIYRPGGMIDLKPLYPQDYELYWFLKYCSMFVQNGLNSGANKNKNYSCIIHEPEKDEQEEAERDAIIYKVGGLIFNSEEEHGLSESKLRDIAAAFGIKDSVHGRLPGVRLKLKHAVEKDEKTPMASGDSKLRGYKYFLKLATEDGYDFSLRSNITKAIELGVLEYESARRAWFFLGNTEPGAQKEYIEKIVGCEPTDNKESHLVNFLIKNSDMKDRFDAKLAEKLDNSGDSEADYENLKTMKAKYEEAGDTEKVIETIKKMLEIKPKNPKLKGELTQLEKSLV